MNKTSTIMIMMMVLVLGVVVGVSPTITNVTLVGSNVPATNDSNLVCHITFSDADASDDHNITVSWLRDNNLVYNSEYVNHTNKAINDTLKGTIEDLSFRVVPQTGFYVKDFAIYYNHFFNFYHIKGISGQTWTTKGNEIDLGYQKSQYLEQYSIQDDVLPIGATNTWDSGNIWAPNIFKNGSKYYMIYTGVNNWTTGHPEKNVQRIGLAYSYNLKDWTRVPQDNCIVATGVGCVWDCNTTWSTWGNGVDWQQNCRDPHVIKIGDYYYMSYSASHLTYPNSLIIGIANSSNLINWTDMGSITTTRNTTAESSNLWVGDGYVYLYWTSNGGSGDRQIRYTYTTLDNFRTNSGWSTRLQAANGQFASEMINTTEQLGYNTWAWLPNSGNYILMQRVSMRANHTVNFSAIPVTNLDSMTSNGEGWKCNVVVTDTSGASATLISNRICIGGNCTYPESYPDAGLDTDGLTNIIKIFVVIIFIMSVIYLIYSTFINGEGFDWNTIVGILIAILCIGIIASL